MSLDVFDVLLNDFCQKFLIKTPGTPDPTVQEFLNAQKEVVLRLFEEFLLFESVCIKLHGENLPLAILLNHLGVKGLESLIDQGAIEFLLWDQMVTYLVDDIPGVDPLQHGRYSSPAHSDPEESIRLGLNAMTKQLPTSDRKNIIRKVRDVYHFPEENLSKNAVSISKSTYESGRLKTFGLDPQESTFRELNASKREKLCNCTEELLQYSYLLNSNKTSYTNFTFFQLFNDSNRKLHDASNLQDNFNKLAKLENLPDLRNLFFEIDQPFKKITKIRDKRSSRKFREWLYNCENGQDGVEITKEYVDAIANSKGFFQTTTGKFSKTVAISSIGAGVGLALAGPIGAAGGAGAAKVLEPVVDVGFDLLDEFLLAGLMKGWTPKMFFDNISSLEKSNASTDVRASRC